MNVSNDMGDDDDDDETRRRDDDERYGSRRYPEPRLVHPGEENGTGRKRVPANTEKDLNWKSARWTT